MSKPDRARAFFAQVVQQLIKNGIIDDVAVAELAVQQFAKFISVFCETALNESRVDEFYRDCVQSRPEHDFEHFLTVVKLALVLPHGNSPVS
jgi:hypothetical protein